VIARQRARGREPLLRAAVPPDFGALL